METKLIEIRDRATFIPAIAIGLLLDHPHNRGVGHTTPEELERYEAERYLLRRAGYGDEMIHGPASVKSEVHVLLTRLDGGTKCEYDPYAWGNRTWNYAHSYLISNWSTVVSGQVLDVEVIAGEKSEDDAKISERLTAPL